jgi:hypothetical protein
VRLGGRLVVAELRALLDELAQARDELAPAEAAAVALAPALFVLKRLPCRRSRHTERQARGRRLARARARPPPPLVLSGDAASLTPY